MFKYLIISGIVLLAACQQSSSISEENASEQTIANAVQVENSPEEDVDHSQMAMPISNWQGKYDAEESDPSGRYLTTFYIAFFEESNQKMAHLHIDGSTTMLRHICKVVPVGGNEAQLLFARYGSDDQEKSGYQVGHSRGYISLVGDELHFRATPDGETSLIYHERKE
jgi:hypothetical protein